VVKKLTPSNFRRGSGRQSVAILALVRGSAIANIATAQVRKDAMKNDSSHELDLQIQLSLVTKIRQAARQYKAEPVETDSAAFLAYVSALECLADHIDAKCRASRPMHRVIPFPVIGSNPPFTAA
jgi:hypothetical protein